MSDKKTAALKLVLIFFAGGSFPRQEWDELIALFSTSRIEATTKNLCDAVRAALAEEKDDAAKGVYLRSANAISQAVEKAYAAAMYRGDRDICPVSIDAIEALIRDNTVTETAWRGAFEHSAKEIGCNPDMTHCSAATFAVLKAIKELKYGEIVQTGLGNQPLPAAGDGF